MPVHPELSRILSSNAQWARDVANAEPQFFSESAKGQAPKILWIGCSDSRIPESVVTASRPGDIFVHRNIANQVFLDDDSVQSVIAFAVTNVKVDHAVVVGHTNCGGAAACLSASQSGDFETTVPGNPPSVHLNKWLASLTRLAASLDLSGKSPAEALDAVVEENVKVQVQNLAKAEPILAAWKETGRKLHIHGWVYDLEKGQLKDLQVSQGPE